MEINVPAKDIPQKLNTQELASEVANKLGLPPGLVALSYFGHGDVFLRAPDGKETKKAEPERLVLAVPDGSPASKVLEAVRAHSPARDDHEEQRARDEAAFEARVLDLPKVRELLAEVRGLKGLEGK